MKVTIVADTLGQAEHRAKYEYGADPDTLSITSHPGKSRDGRKQYVAEWTPPDTALFAGPAPKPSPYANVSTDDLLEIRYGMEARPATPEVIAVCLRISTELRRRADDGEDVVTRSRAVLDRNVAIENRIAAERKRR